MLIGSRAIAYHNPNFTKFIRDDTDWDVIAPTRINVSGVETHLSSEYLSQEAVDRFVTSDTVEVPGVGKVPVCSLRGLAAIKRSHLSLDWQWEKHMAQWVYLSWFRNEDDWEYVKRREKITLEKAKQRAPKLNVSKDDFFNDYVEKKYDHDMLHTLVAFYDAPLYTKLQATNSEVYCDIELWNRLSHTDKVLCVAEETHVIAIERFCVPSQWKCYPREAYLKSLKKVCTTLTSGWFRDFAIDNYAAIRAAYTRPTFDRVKLICP